LRQWLRQGLLLLLVLLHLVLLLLLSLLLLSLLLLGLLPCGCFPGRDALRAISFRLLHGTSKDFDAEALMEIIVASEVAVRIAPVILVTAAEPDMLEVTHQGDRWID